MHLITYLKSIKQNLTELKGVDKLTIIIGYFNMLRAVTDKTSKKSQKKNIGLSIAINHYIQ